MCYQQWRNSMYFLKYVDEYGQDNYYMSDETDNPVRFVTKGDAIKQANKLIQGEFDTFGLVVTKYYVVEISEKPVESVDVFKVNDDKESHTCIISATGKKVDVIAKAFDGAKSVFDCKVVTDKTYKNGSKVLEFTYSHKLDEFNAVITYSGNAFVVAYKSSDRQVMNSIVSMLEKKYHDNIVYFSDRMEDGMCSLSFGLSDKTEEFKNDLITTVKSHFNPKILNA